MVGLTEAGSLFLTFIIDAAIGYIEISLQFTALLFLFIFSIFLFTGNCTQDTKNCIKTVKPVGFVLVLLSVLFYLTAPYLVKISERHGANEISINLGYYAVAVPYFLYQYLKHKKSQTSLSAPTSKWWNNLYILCFIIGTLEALYYVFETISFINDIPTVVIIISQMRIFLLFILSVIFKTDNFTLKKLLALILGSISVIGVYLT